VPPSLRGASLQAKAASPSYTGAAGEAPTGSLTEHHVSHLASLDAAPTQTPSTRHPPSPPPPPPPPATTTPLSLGSVGEVCGAGLLSGRRGPAKYSSTPDVVGAPTGFSHRRNVNQPAFPFDNFDNLDKLQIDRQTVEFEYSSKYVQTGNISQFFSEKYSSKNAHSILVEI